MGLKSVLSFAHALVAERVRDGDVVIDATVGNGVDTCFLTRLVGSRGVVYGFDIQEDAIRQTRERLLAEVGDARMVKWPVHERSEFGRRGLEGSRSRGIATSDAGDFDSGGQGTGGRLSSNQVAGNDAAGVQELSARCRLVCAGHERMTEFVDEKHRGRVAAVMFNLGYLPGAGRDHIVTRAETTLVALEAALGLLRRDGVLTVVVYPGHAGGGDEAAAVEGWAAELPGDWVDVVSYRMVNRRPSAPYLLAFVKRNDRSGTANQRGFC